MDPAKGKPVLLQRLEGRGFELELVLSADRLEAQAKLNAPPKGPPIAPEKVLELLERACRELPSAQRAALPNYAAALAQHRPQVVARGQAPQPWGEIAWLIPIQPGRLLDDSRASKVDVHEVGHFVNVRAGQALCELPLAPAAGRDVLGLPIAPADCPVKAGKNVSAESNGRLLALVEGCAMLQAGVLSVETLLELRGDLGFRTGNIDFRGDVVIHGSVPDGFHVKAARSVTVDGSVGATVIEAGGELVIKGGVNGLGRGRLQAGANLKVHYLHHVEAACAGDLTVDIECLESRVHAGGKIAVARGSIIGGALHAGGGVSAVQIGSEACVRTVVIAGLAGDDEAQVSRVRDAYVKATADAKDAARALGVRADRPQAVAQLPPRERQKAAALQAQLDAARAQAKRSEELLRTLAREAGDASATISVARRVHPNVLLGAGACVREIHAELQGPVVLGIDRQKGALEIVPRAK